VENRDIVSIYHLAEPPGVGNIAGHQLSATIEAREHLGRDLAVEQHYFVNGLWRVRSTRELARSEQTSRQHLP
jgi:hypothetical protein